MTQEEKQLLLKDLCARLYTGTIVNYNDLEGCDYELSIRTLSNFPEESLKCYLRPMSSMTEEERIEFERLSFIYDASDGSMLFGEKGLDWLNTNHFDYRGLIEKGLALEAKEGMYEKF